MLKNTWPGGTEEKQLHAAFKEFSAWARRHHVPCFALMYMFKACMSKAS